MNLRGSILKMISEVDGTWECAAPYLGMTVAALHNRAYHVKGQSLTPEQALALQGLSKTTLFAEAVALASGGTFVNIPSGELASGEELSRKFHELYAELGEFSRQFMAATADEEIDAGERETLEAIANKMHRNLSELLGLSFKIYCRERQAVRK